MKHRNISVRMGIIFLSLIAVFGVWLLSGPLRAQDTTSLKKAVDAFNPLVYFEQRLLDIQEENKNDYRAMRDLYQRNQLMEKKLRELDRSLNQKIRELELNNENLRSSVNLLEEKIDYYKRSRVYSDKVRFYSSPGNTIQFRY